MAPPLERVITELCKLPGIGRKSAQRLVFHLLKSPVEDVVALARALDALHEGVRACSVCFNLAADELCEICADTRRDRSVASSIGWEVVLPVGSSTGTGRSPRTTISVRSIGIARCTARDF